MTNWERIKSLKNQIWKAKEQGRDKEIPELEKKLDKCLKKLEDNKEI